LSKSVIIVNFQQLLYVHYINGHRYVLIAIFPKMRIY